MVVKEKTELRQTLLAQRRQLSDETVRNASEQVCLRLQTWLEREGITQIALYRAIRREPSMLPLEQHWPASQRFYPRIGPGRQMEFRSLNPAQAWERNSLGIEEPPADAPLMSPDRHTALIVPAVAYDRQRFRLGYGGGYYDVFLPGFPGRVLGVCYDAFVLDALPRADHDQPVHVVMTDKAIY